MNWMTSAKTRLSRNKRKHKDQRMAAHVKVARREETYVPSSMLQAVHRPAPNRPSHDLLYLSPGVVANKPESNFNNTQERCAKDVLDDLELSPERAKGVGDKETDEESILENALVYFNDGVQCTHASGPLIPSVEKIAWLSTRFGGVREANRQADNDRVPQGAQEVDWTEKYHILVHSLHALSSLIAARRLFLLAGALPADEEALRTLIESELKASDGRRPEPKTVLLALYRALNRGDEARREWSYRSRQALFEAIRLTEVADKQAHFGAEQITSSIAVSVSAESGLEEDPGSVVNADERTARVDFASWNLFDENGVNQVNKAGNNPVEDSESLPFAPAADESAPLDDSSLELSDFL